MLLILTHGCSATSATSALCFRIRHALWHDHLKQGWSEICVTTTTVTIQMLTKCIFFFLKMNISRIFNIFSSIPQHPNRYSGTQIWSPLEILEPPSGGLLTPGGNPKIQSEHLTVTRSFHITLCAEASLFL